MAWIPRPQFRLATLMLATAAVATMVALLIQLKQVDPEFVGQANVAILSLPVVGSILGIARRARPIDLIAQVLLATVLVLGFFWAAEYDQQVSWLIGCMAVTLALAFVKVRGVAAEMDAGPRKARLERAVANAFAAFLNLYLVAACLFVYSVYFRE